MRAMKVKRSVEVAGTAGGRGENGRRTWNRADRMRETGAGVNVEQRRPVNAAREQSLSGTLVPWFEREPGMVKT
jgi:hypothetical protein